MKIVTFIKEHKEVIGIGLVFLLYFIVKFFK